MEKNNEITLRRYGFKKYDHCEHCGKEIIIKAEIKEKSEDFTKEFIKQKIIVEGQKVYSMYINDDFMAPFIL